MAGPADAELGGCESFRQCIFVYDGVLFRLHLRSGCTTREWSRRTRRNLKLHRPPKAWFCRLCGRRSEAGGGRFIPRGLPKQVKAPVCPHYYTIVQALVIMLKTPLTVRRRVSIMLIGDDFSYFPVPNYYQIPNATNLRVTHHGQQEGLSYRQSTRKRNRPGGGENKKRHSIWTVEAGGRDTIRLFIFRFRTQLHQTLCVGSAIIYSVDQRHSAAPWNICQMHGEIQ